MTKGEYRVGIAFNPSGDDLVARIKRAAADLIDLIETIPLPNILGIASPEERAPLSDQLGEVVRLKSLAQTHAEDAAMWAVKAATKGPMA